MGSIPPRSSTAILWASILSFLALPPWMAFMYRAWPRTKAMPSWAQRSATQYQVKMHSTATTRSSRYAAMVARKCSGVAGPLRWTRTVPAASRMQMYIRILHAAGTVRVHRNGPATPEHFLATIAAYREDLVVAVECIFTWYWVADLCAQEGIAFVLGHALYMKAIHGGKAKNDKIDAHKIAVLLRGGMLPQAYVYPAEMRATRDLLRRRCHFTRKRAELLTHIQNTASQYLLPTLGKIAHHGNRTGVAEQFDDPAVRKSIETNLALVDHYDRLITDLELHLTRTAKVHDATAFYRLRSVPGIG